MNPTLVQLLGAIVLLILFIILMFVSTEARAILKRSLMKPFVSEKYSRSSEIKWTPIFKEKLPKDKGVSNGRGE